MIRLYNLLLRLTFFKLSVPLIKLIYIGGSQAELVLISSCRLLLFLALVLLAPKKILDCDFGEDAEKIYFGSRSSSASSSRAAGFFFFFPLSFFPLEIY